MKELILLRFIWNWMAGRHHSCTSTSKKVLTRTFLFSTLIRKGSNHHLYDADFCSFKLFNFNMIRYRICYGFKIFTAHTTAIIVQYNAGPSLYVIWEHTKRLWVLGTIQSLTMMATTELSFEAGMMLKTRSWNWGVTACDSCPAKKTGWDSLPGRWSERRS